MDSKCILLDTSFFIRLLNENDSLHQNTLDYYKFFLEKQFTLKCSTISISEYCVRGLLEELPLKDIQILPFNINHAQKAGEFARIIFENKGKLETEKRNIIPNDTNLFAQAEVENDITSFATSDEECIKIYNLLKQSHNLKFDTINIRQPFNENFGLLDLK
ncbi:MAG: PIN domain-containing protein [Ignavibacteriaceae bacterium]